MTILCISFASFSLKHTTKTNKHSKTSKKLKTNNMTLTNKKTTHSPPPPPKKKKKKKKTFPPAWRGHTTHLPPEQNSSSASVVDTDSDVGHSGGAGRRSEALQKFLPCVTFFLVCFVFNVNFCPMVLCGAFCFVICLNRLVDFDFS